MKISLVVKTVYLEGGPDDGETICEAWGFTEPLEAGKKCMELEKAGDERGSVSIFYLSSIEIR